VARSPRDRAERGAVTVEFAVALPVVATVLTVGMVGVVLVDAQGRLQSAAGAAARAAGRDGDDTGRRVVAEVAAGATATVTHDDGLVCVTVTRPVAGGPFAGLLLRGRACAVEERP
jgi:Flp pilus assembly protein TadG